MSKPVPEFIQRMSFAERLKLASSVSGFSEADLRNALVRLHAIGAIDKRGQPTAIFPQVMAALEEWMQEHNPKRRDELLAAIAGVEAMDK